MAILAMVLFVLTLVFGPLLVFAPQLANAKRQGLSEYGTLAERYVRDFDCKWLRSQAPTDESFIGGGDTDSSRAIGAYHDATRRAAEAVVWAHFLEGSRLIEVTSFSSLPAFAGPAHGL